MPLFITLTTAKNIYTHNKQNLIYYMQHDLRGFFLSILLILSTTRRDNRATVKQTKTDCIDIIVSHRRQRNVNQAREDGKLGGMTIISLADADFML